MEIIGAAALGWVLIGARRCCAASGLINDYIVINWPCRVFSLNSTMPVDYNQLEFINIYF